MLLAATVSMRCRGAADQGAPDEKADRHGVRDLDGVMEAPSGEPTHPHTGSVFDFVGPEQMEFKLQEALEADAHLIVRVTYESFAGAWPERTGEFAEKVNSMPNYV